jgi:hypothetical protein
MPGIFTGKMVALPFHELLDGKTHITNPVPII